MRVTEKYVFFWGGEFSNWATVPGGITYVNKNTGELLRFESSEQLFMYLKAEFFGDYEISEKILKSSDPKEAKKLGRKIKGFDEESWSKVREDIMYEAVSCKAVSWPYFRAQLQKYRDKCFVEASPYDKIWGDRNERG